MYVDYSASRSAIVFGRSFLENSGVWKVWNVVLRMSYFVPRETCWRDLGSWLDVAGALCLRIGGLWEGIGRDWNWNWNLEKWTGHSLGSSSDWTEFGLGVLSRRRGLGGGMDALVDESRSFCCLGFAACALVWKAAHTHRVIL